MINFKYLIIIMIITQSKKIKHANKSLAKQSPETKYAILKRSKNKSDIFVLSDWLRITAFIFL